MTMRYTLLLLLAACGGPTPLADTPDPPPAGDGPEAGPAVAPGGGAPMPIAAAGPSPGACHLPEPLLSGDACQTDADCGVSAPCHAAACVAVAKAQPPDADTVCTKSLECRTADANRCGCHQGQCALVPPAEQP